MKKIVIIAASNNNNLRLSQAIHQHIQTKDIESEIIDLVQMGLPLYTNDCEQGDRPKELLEVLPKLESAQAMFFVSPEYNGGPTPALVNFISWVSRCGNEDWRKYFNEKPAVVATHSGGGGAHVLLAMRTQLSFVGMNVLGRQIMTNYGKELNQDSLEAVTENLLRYI
jgi:chromate reductase